MSKPFLSTKLFIPPLQANIVKRSHLVQKMNGGLHRKMTLISAPAGFGKTTTTTECISEARRPVCWLSLDPGDNDPKRFWSYVITALKSVSHEVGDKILSLLQTPQPPSFESVITRLINELITIEEDFILVLDDFHVIGNPSIDETLTFFIENMPVNIHLVIATREEPNLPLAKLRTKGQLTEIRVADLRFNLKEAEGFFNNSMKLNLNKEDVSALEKRTEGWIAGLQLAAISMKGQEDIGGFIGSFTGSHHFVMDYLFEEVLRQQADDIHDFLLRTSILQRMCGSLCDALTNNSPTSGQQILEKLQKSNLFIIPLDNERCWYRYHHLFADLLQNHLKKRIIESPANGKENISNLHIRASQWYEENGWELEAFHHATRANDLDRAARLIAGKGIPLYVRGGLHPVMSWLKSLPKTEMDKRPSLWIFFAGAMTVAGQTSGVEEKLLAAEHALDDGEMNDHNRDLLGRIANNRATLAISEYNFDEAKKQAKRALEYLHHDNLPVRSISSWVLGTTHEFKGERKEAIKVFSETLSMSQLINHLFVIQLAYSGLGSVLFSQNNLHEAAETSQKALDVFKNQQLPFDSEAHLILARIFYEWNDLKKSREHAHTGLQLAHQYARNIDRFVIFEVFLARLMFMQGRISEAVSALEKIEHTAKKKNFIHRMNEISTERVFILLRQGKKDEASKIAHSHNLPLSLARVYIAEKNENRAFEVLDDYLKQTEMNEWNDEILKTLVLRAMAFDAIGDKDKAIENLEKALILAEPGGFIRTFLDEGDSVIALISEISDLGKLPAYTEKILRAYESSKDTEDINFFSTVSQPLIEPLSKREMEILKLIAKGLSNTDICEKLSLALPTVKGHNRNIFGKLQVERRTEAVARARELGLL